MLENEKLQRKLFIKPYDRMIDDLIYSIDRGEIILDPDYQRNYVWDNKKASLLVESILLNIPIPVIYSSEDEQGKWVIVDGLQRLYSLKRFFKDEFKLTGLEALDGLNGLKYSSLPENIRNKVNHGELRVVVIQNDSDPEIQFDIFMRLNTGSIKLNEQELRNCLYRGKLNNLIKDIVRNNYLVREMIPFGKDRMQANEMILRYLALSEKFNRQNYNIVDYDGRIKNLINSFMKRYQNPTDDELHRFGTKIIDQLEKAFKIFGEGAFKKNDQSTRPNASLMDSILIAFEDYSIEDLISNKESIIEAKRRLIENGAFIESINHATGNTESIVYRVSAVIEELKIVMNNEI